MIVQPCPLVRPMDVAGVPFSTCGTRIPRRPSCPASWSSRPVRQAAARTANVYRFHPVEVPVVIPKRGEALSARGPLTRITIKWWRGRDLNPRPSAYECWCWSRTDFHLSCPASSGWDRRRSFEQMFDLWPMGAAGPTCVRWRPLSHPLGTEAREMSHGEALDLRTPSPTSSHRGANPKVTPSDRRFRRNRPSAGRRVAAWRAARGRT